MPQSEEILKAALFFRSQGLPIFPVSWDAKHEKRKAPLVEWTKYLNPIATEDEVRRWWAQWPDAGIGLAMGRVSGLCVVDAERGADFSLLGLDGLETPTVKSGGGGRHWYFRYDQSLAQLRNSTRFAPLYDFKTEGGYVIVPPSPHESGGMYEWIIPFGACDPSPLSEEVRRALGGRARGNVSVLLNGVVKEGSRNNSAASIVGSLLARYSESEWEAIAWPLFQSWNEKHVHPPLSEQELRITFESIAHRELEKRAADHEVEDAKSESLAQELVRLAREDGIELHQNEFGDPFIRFRSNGHQEVWPLESRNAKRWLQYLYWNRRSRVVRGDALTQALDTLGSIAVFEGKQHKFVNRVARTSDGSIWYDLTDDDWCAVRITAAGWYIEQNPPALFRRYAHQRAQVQPVRGGDIWDLRRFVNISNDHQFLLFLVLLLSCFIPDFPHPIPIVYGSHGAAKTMALRIARMLIDPSSTGVPRFPKQPEALIQTLAHNWFAPFDNVDALSQDASDTICAAVTGMGFSKRALYTNDEDFHYAFRRCVGLNGINLVGTNADLLDRSILFQLDRIPKEQRKDEAVFLKEFADALPGILGGCFDVLSKTLAVYPSITLPRKPRMADFAVWGSAITEALGRSRQVFLDAYERNIASQNEELLDEHPIAVAIMHRLAPGAEWDGNATELHRDLKETLKEIGGDGGAQQLPKNPSALSKELNKIKPNLADAGISIERLQRSGRSRVLRIRREADPPVTPVIPSGETKHEGNSSDATVTGDGDSENTVTSLESGLIVMNFSEVTRMTGDSPGGAFSDTRSAET